MTQKAISSMFPTAKHYSQATHNSTQDKDYIVTMPGLTAGKGGGKGAANRKVDKLS